MLLSLYQIKRERESERRERERETSGRGQGTRSRKIQAIHKEILYMALSN